MTRPEHAANPPSSGSPPPSAWVVRWPVLLLRAVWTLLAVVAVLIIAGYGLLQYAVARVVADLVGSAVPGKVEYRLVRVTPWELVVADVRLPGDGAPRAAVLAVRFDPLRVISGDIDVVRIAGLHLTVAIAADGVKVPGLPAGGGNDATWWRGLPARIELTDAVLHLDLAGSPRNLPMSAVLRRQGDTLHVQFNSGPGEWTASGQLHAAATPAGQLTFQTDGTARLPATLALTLVQNLAPQTRLPDSSLLLDGQLVVTWVGSGGAQPPRWQLAARTEQLSAAVFDLGHARDVHAELTATLADGRWRFDGQLSARLATPHLAGEQSLTATAAWHDDQLHATAALAGPDLTADLARLTARRSADGSWVLGGVARFAWTPDARWLGRLPTPGLELHRPRVVCGDVQFTYAGGWTATVSDLTVTADRIVFGEPGPASVRWTFDRPQLHTASAAVAWSPGTPLSVSTGQLVLHTVLTPPLPGFDVAGGVAVQATAPAAHMVWTDPGGPELAVPELALDAACPSLALHGVGWLGRSPADDLRVDDPKLALRLSLQHSTAQTRLTLTQQAALSWSALHVAGTVTAGPAAIEVSPDPERPLLQLGDATASTSASLRLREPRVRAADADWAARGIDLQLQLTRQTSHPWTLDGRVRVDDLHVRHADAGFAVEGLDLEVPLAARFESDATSPPTEGRFTVRSLLYRDRPFPGVTGTLFLSPTALWAGLDWPVLTEGVVKASASVDWRRDVVTQLDVWLPEFDFTRADEIRSLLPDALATADIRGRFAAKLSYYINPETVVRWGEIEVRNGSLRSRELDAELLGVSGRVWTRSFSPLETPPGQTVSVERARLGRFDVRNGRVDFRLDPGDILFVESARFEYADGEVTARGFRVQPGRGAADVVVYADNLDIGRLAAQFSDGRISGSGRLYARLPLTVVWPQRVELGSGYIYAEASGNPGPAGVLRLTGYAQDIGRLVGLSMGGPSGDPARDAAVRQVQTRVTDALVEFGFTSLTLDLTRPEQGPLTVTIRTTGRGPTAAPTPPTPAPAPPTRGRTRPPPSPTPAPASQELNLTFNVTGLEALVNAYLGLRQTGLGF